MPRKWNDDNYTTKKRSRKRCYVFNRAEIINVTISYQSFFWCEDVFMLMFLMWYFRVKICDVIFSCYHLSQRSMLTNLLKLATITLTRKKHIDMAMPAIQAGLYYRWARRESSSLELANFYNDNFVLSFLRRFWGMCWLLCRSEPQGGDFFDIDDVVSDADE